MGGHFMFEDDQQTPNDLNCAFQFDLPEGKRKLITFEVRHWITNHEAEIGTPELGTHEPHHKPGMPALGPLAGRHNTVGDIFYGSKGYFATGDEDADTYKVWLGPDQEAQPAVHAGAEVAHFANFIDCVVSRKKENLNAPIEEGYVSMALCSLPTFPIAWADLEFQSRDPGSHRRFRSRHLAARRRPRLPCALHFSGAGLSVNLRF